VFLGPDADQIRLLTDLRGKRIGIGPSGSGTERLVRQVFAPLAELNLRLSTHSMDEQLAKLEAGELDLGAMGQEFSYRYQEALIAGLLYALRTFRDRLDR
jgi:TRAP-type uncharacterized transport system substrate-binding protein